MKDKTHIIANFLWTDLVISSHFREGETPSYTRINTVYELISTEMETKKKMVE